MLRHKQNIFILLVAVLVICTFTTGAKLATGINKPELPVSADLSKVNTNEPATVPAAKPASPDSSLASDDTDVQTKVAKDDRWKQAYIDYVQNTLIKDSWERYELINLDDDDVPELIAIGSCEAQGNMVCSYYNGNVNSAQLNRLGFFYIEGENLLCNSEGNMDYYYDIVYSLTDGKLTQIAAGHWGELDNSSHQFDKDGNLIYQYSWDGVTVTEAQYKQYLNSVFDMSKATQGYTDKSCSATGIIDLIEKY